MRVLVAITSSTSPYLLDLPRVLSLPPGFEFRFRYRYRWTSQEVQQETVSSASALVGNRMLLMFHSVKRVLVPIRWATVVGTERVGPFLHVRFRVQGFAVVGHRDGCEPEPPPWATSANRGTHADMYARAGVQVVGQPDWPALDRLPDGAYLAHREVPDAITESPTGASVEPLSHSRAWARVAAAIVDDPALKGTPLFYVVGFEDSKLAYASPQSVIEPRRWGLRLVRRPTLALRAFGLTEGLRYRLRVAQWSEQMSTNSVRVTTQVSPPVLLQEGASDTVVGAYDVLEYSFVATRTGSGELSIGAEALTKMEAGGVQFRVRVPVTVGRNWLQVCAILFLTGGGIYLAAWPPGWPSWLPQPAVSSVTAGLVRQFVRLAGAMLASTGFGGFIEKVLKIRDDASRLLPQVSDLSGNKNP